MQTIEEALAKLSRSGFRAGFHLSRALRAYAEEKGTETLREHAREFVHTRLAPAYIPNDGKQTPMRGHPVFIAQHATATCCRGCLEKWYRVKAGRELTPAQEEKIVNLIMAWLEREMQNDKNGKIPPLQG
jgi:exodeoxyribonuclease V alpha subunit